jgi:hypothetical protein
MPLVMTAMAITLFFMTCAHLTKSETDLLLKIAARRLGNYGVQYAPIPFTELGQIAGNACNRPDETLTPAAALEVIIEVITLRLDDPLLAADLKDLISLLEVRVDAAFKLIGLTPELERLIKIAVCSFSEGVSMNPSSKTKPIKQED